MNCIIIKTKYSYYSIGVPDEELDFEVRALADQVISANTVKTFKVGSHPDFTVTPELLVNKIKEWNLQSKKTKRICIHTFEPGQYIYLDPESHRLIKLISKKYKQERKKLIVREPEDEPSEHELEADINELLDKIAASTSPPISAVIEVPEDIDDIPDLTRTVALPTTIDDLLPDIHSSIAESIFKAKSTSKSRRKANRSTSRPRLDLEQREDRLCKISTEAHVMSSKCQHFECDASVKDKIYCVVHWVGQYRIEVAEFLKNASLQGHTTLTTRPIGRKLAVKCEKLNCGATLHLHSGYCSGHLAEATAICMENCREFGILAPQDDLILNIAQPTGSGFMPKCTHKTVKNKQKQKCHATQVAYGKCGRHLSKFFIKLFTQLFKSLTETLDDVECPSNGICFCGNPINYGYFCGNHIPKQTILLQRINNKLSPKRKKRTVEWTGLDTSSDSSDSDSSGEWV